MQRRLLLTLMVVALAGCAGEGETSVDAGGDEPIAISDAWMRPPTGPNAAIYMTIDNRGSAADTLVAAEADLCDVTELHMTTVEDDVMTMLPLPDGITITPGASIVLGPGALHIMCLGVDPELTDGSAAVTLEFASAGQVTVTAEIRQEP